MTSRRQKANAVREKMQSAAAADGRALKLTLPALRFEPEAFERSGSRIMGRQAAGEAFLRAAVEAAKDRPLIGFGPKPRSGQAFQALLRKMNPDLRTGWIGTDDLRAFAEIGAIHLPDPSIAEQANLGVRAGSGAYSITDGRGGKVPRGVSFRLEGGDRAVSGALGGPAGSAIQGANGKEAPASRQHGGSIAPFPAVFRLSDPATCGNNPYQVEPNVPQCPRTS